jgi:hypothetical protein
MKTPFCAPRTSISLIAAIAALTPLLGHAQSWIKPGEETAILRVGAVSGRFNTSARIDGSSTTGRDLSLETDGGLNSDYSTYLLDGTLRLAKNHRIDAAYGENKRSATKTTDRSYTIGDTVIPAGTSLSTEDKTALGYLGYRYSFFKTPGGEVAAGLGAYGGNVKFKFTANQPVVDINKSTTLPLPVLVLTGDLYPTERLTLSAGLRGLKVTIGDVDGSVLQAGLRSEYFFTNHFGVGAAIERFDLKVDVSKSGFHGETELKATSGQLYLTMRF